MLAAEPCLTYRAEIRVRAQALAGMYGDDLLYDFEYVSSSHKHSMTRTYGYCQRRGLTVAAYLRVNGRCHNTRVRTSTAGAGA